MIVFFSGAGEILSLEISKIIVSADSAEVSGENLQNVQKRTEPCALRLCSTGQLRCVPCMRFSKIFGPAGQKIMIFSTVYSA